MVTGKRFIIVLNTYFTVDPKILCFTTERFTDLGKLKLQIVVWFRARANFHYLPSCLKKLVEGNNIVYEYIVMVTSYLTSYLWELKYVGN
jgi:hypothetical protein